MVDIGQKYELVCVLYRAMYIDFLNYIPLSGLKLIRNSDSCIYLLKIRLNIIVNNVFNYRIQKKWKIRDKNDTNISRSDNPSRSKSTMKYWAWQCIEIRAEHLSSSRIWFTYLWFFSRLHFLPKYMVKLFELSHECRKYNRYKRNTMRLEKMDQ